MAKKTIKEQDLSEIIESGIFEVDTKTAKYNFFTKELKKEFLDTYVNNGYNIKKACEIVNIAPNTFYAHIKTDQEFINAFNETNNIALNAVLSVLLEAMMHSDWSIKKWAVERMMKSTLLKKFDLSELVSKDGSNLNSIIINKEDIIIE